MVEQARLRGMRARWLTADETYGDNPRFLDVVDAVGWWYVAEVKTNLEVWPTRPKLLPPSPRGAVGRPRKKARLARKSDKSVPVAKLAARLGERHWQRLTVAEGAKGRRVFDFAFLRVVAKRAGLPGQDAMLAHAFLTCARVTWAKTHSPPLGTENAEARGPGEKGTAA